MKITNFTQESCSGTTTLTLLGATSGNLTLANVGVVDGDLFPFSLQAQGGERVEGIGKYNTGGTITRYDIWYWNGTTVTENRYPGETNLTLAAGTHTITVGMGAYLATALSDNHRSDGSVAYNGFLNSDTGGVGAAFAADTQFAFAYHLKETAEYASLEIKVQTAQAGALASIGLTRMINGKPDTDYIASGTIDVTSTGVKTLTLNTPLMAGYYFAHYVCDNAGVQINCLGSNVGAKAIGWTPLKETPYDARRSPTAGYGKGSVTGGVLDANPETVTSEWSVDTNGRVPYFVFNRV